MDFINSLINLDEFTEIKLKDDTLKLKLRKTGSCFSDKISLAISDYTIAKKEFKKEITKEYIADLMYDVEKRKKWDEGYKDLIKVEGDKDCYIIRSIMKSPMIMISERDMLDKRIEFTHDNIYYNFSSAIDDEVNLYFYFSYIFLVNS